MNTPNISTLIRVPDESAFTRKATTTTSRTPRKPGAPISAKGIYQRRAAASMPDDAGRAHAVAIGTTAARSARRTNGRD